MGILRDIHKEETVEYVLALIDEMLTGEQVYFFEDWTGVTYVLEYNNDNFFTNLSANPKRARLFHDKSLADEDTYEPFLS